MESLNNGGHNTSTRHLMPPSKTSNARNGLHLELLVEAAPWKSPNIIDDCQGY